MKLVSALGLFAGVFCFGAQGSLGVRGAMGLGEGSALGNRCVARGVVAGGAVAMKPGLVRPGDVVTIKAFDDVPEHQFLVDEMFEDFVTGFAVTGDLAGEYGEPALFRVLMNPYKPKK